jgi:hypothetical protein
MFGSSTNMMMSFALASLGLAAVAIICRSVLAGWRDWIALQREQLAMGQKANLPQDGHDAQAITRIEMADMRERLRQLEAIAAGVDL